MSVDTLMAKLHDSANKEAIPEEEVASPTIPEGSVSYEVTPVGTPLNTVTPKGIHISLPITTSDVGVIAHMDELSVAYPHLIKVTRG